MTKDDLIKDGWKPELCKIGTLYFKGDFFGHLKDDNFVMFGIDDDMNPLGTAKTFEDIKQIKKEYDLNLIQSVKEKIQGLERYLSWLTKRFEENYGSINI